MVTTVRSLGLTGVSGYEVTVECMLSGGLPAFDVVGLPDAPASDCISHTLTLVPKMFFWPAADHWSTRSAMGEDGVIG